MPDASKAAAVAVPKAKKKKGATVLKTAVKSVDPTKWSQANATPGEALAQGHSLTFLPIPRMLSTRTPNAAQLANQLTIRVAGQPIVGQKPAAQASMVLSVWCSNHFPEACLLIGQFQIRSEKF